MKTSGSFGKSGVPAFKFFIACFFVLSILGPGHIARADAFEWPESTPEEVDIDPQMVSQLLTAAGRGDFGHLKSLLILRHGRLVLESYFNGYTRNDLMPLYSVTKSWGSAVVGIAMSNQDVPGLDSTVSDLFPGYQDLFNASPGKTQITFRDLLTMRHGLAWDEWSTYFTNPQNPVNAMTQSADWWRYVLSRPQTAAPDSVFRYSTGVANLMGGVIWNFTGQSALEYSIEHLFDPLDIRDHYLEVDLSGGAKGTGIRNFQVGLTPTGHGLWLKPLDLAKIGQLYLDRGAWQSRRLMASDWIDQSWGSYSNAETDPQVFPGNVSYGYQWWTYRYTRPQGEIEVHVAEGWADQYIFVIPELDLVVVSTANNGSYNGPDMRTAVRDIILDGVDEDFDPASDGGLTGSWFNPDLKHQGFMLEVVPKTGQVVIYWMTFAPESGAPQWMVAVGMLHGRRAVLEFLQPEGGDFAGSGEASLNSWGDVELIFHSCTTASMEFFSEVAGVEGIIELQRLTPVNSCVDP